MNLRQMHSQLRATALPMGVKCVDTIIDEIGGSQCSGHVEYAANAKSDGIAERHDAAVEDECGGCRHEAGPE